MDQGGINEYHVLAVFSAGVFLHSLGYLRRPSQFVGAVAVASICFGSIWFLSDSDDKSFDLGFGFALSYGGLFSIVFRKILLPNVTTGGVVHCLLLAYYALFSAIQNLQPPLSKGIMVAGIIPGLLILILLLLGGGRGKKIRTLSYVSYLVSILILVGAQFSFQTLANLHNEEGFSLSLFLYVFFGSGVFLVLLSNLMQVLLLLPPIEKPAQRKFWDAITGPVTLHKEQAALMADRFREGYLDWIASLILVTHVLLLMTNYFVHWMSPGLLLNAGLMAVIWIIMPWERKRIGMDLRKEPGNEPNLQTTEP